MSTSEIIFYTAKVCPYAQQVEVAFQEAKTRNPTELGNKPEYVRERKDHQVARLARVRRGPYPDSGLLPNDPVERARVRFFIDTVSAKVFPPFFAFSHHGELSSRRLPSSRSCSRLLPNSPSGDHFTIANAALAPFLGRWELLDLGAFEEGTGPRVVPE
ncbi:hypothetical protein EDB86DRAFT_3083339 [Lactarius hatsudake]|nr:hypothetical protein EDB86DRAFT_3083339 [Lactarius hatsudake]